jgi:hypothetical protein
MRWQADPDCYHEVIHISTSRGKLYSLGPCEPSNKDYG